MSLSQILAAMMQSSGQAPQVTPMGAAPRGGGGGGSGGSPAGTSLNLGRGGGQAPMEKRTMPELEPTTGIDPSQPPVVFGTDDIYEQQRFQQRQDTMLNLAEEWMLADQELTDMQNPTNFKEWKRAWKGGEEKAQERMNQANLGIMEYNQQQQLELQQQEAERVQGVADNVFNVAMETYGDRDVAIQLAQAAMRDPDNANKIVDMIGSSYEAQRAESVEKAETLRKEGREDAAESLKKTQRFHVYSQGFKIPDKVASAMANNTDLSVDEGVKLYFEDKKLKEENKIAIARENAKVRDEIYKATQTIDTVYEALGDVGYFTTGFGSVFSIIPGTPAANLEAAIDTLNATLGFKELFDMRQASTTGGALGNVSNKEVELLYQAWSSLSRKQSPERMRKNLNEVLERFQRVKFLAEQASEGLLLGMSPAQQEKMASEHLSDLKHEGFMIDNPRGSQILSEVRSGAITPKEFEERFGFSPIPDWDINQ
jgi:hypothetical protein